MRTAHKRFRVALYDNIPLHVSVRKYIEDRVAQGETTQVILLKALAHCMTCDRVAGDGTRIVTQPMQVKQQVAAVAPGKPVETTVNLEEIAEKHKNKLKENAARMLTAKF